MKPDFVSIVIPTYNEQEVIERNLISLKNQSYKFIEIVVVDDGSNDRTIEISKKYTKKVFKRHHAERSVQRNFGARKATGKYLLFLDADMELSKNVVSECIKIMKPDANIGAVSIPETPVAATFWEKVKAHERSIYNLEGDDVTDAARFFPKAVFEEVGGYDEEITGPEDWDLPERIKKAGYKMERINALTKHYERVPNPFRVAKKKYYYGLKSHRYMKRHNVSPVSAKTIYFLRPVFYKNWRILFRKPLLTIAMVFMLTLEQLAGGLGYLIGKIKRL